MQLLRQAAKLECWHSGDGFALDVRVSEVVESSIYELEMDDAYGFPSGLRIAFCEECSPDGDVWLLGVRRDSERLTPQMIEMLQHRRLMCIAENSTT